MRTLSFLVILSLFVAGSLFVGCQEQGANIVPGALESSDTSPVNGGPVKNDSLIFLSIPPIAEIIVNTSDTAVVKPKGLARLVATLEYLSLDGRYVTLSAVFVIPQNAVEEPVTISMRIDPYTGSLLFQPSGLVFAEPASLDFSTRNIDPIPENALVQFAYVRTGGPNELITFASLQTIGKSGKIDMLGARINHFSRYAFAR